MYVCADLLPEAAVGVRGETFSSSPRVRLRVEGENTLVVSSHQQDGGQVLGQNLQPGHVQSAGYRPLPCQGQTPAEIKRQEKKAAIISNRAALV